jgi:hypothetical protein
LALDCISFGLKRTRVRHKRVIAKYYPLIEVLDGIPQAHCIAKKCHGRLNIIVWLTWLFNMMTGIPAVRKILYSPLMPHSAVISESFL